MVREILIKPVLNGFLVKVGCQDLVAISLDVMCDEIKRYYQNPEQVEKEYLDKAINKTVNDVCPESQRPEPGLCEAGKGLLPR